MCGIVVPTAYPIPIYIGTIMGFVVFGLCWSIPTTSAIIVAIVRKGQNRKAPQTLWLNLLLLGGALFGVIDHIWNKELFLVGPNPLKDIGLGVVITIAIFIVWGIMVAVSKVRDRRLFTAK